MKEIIYTGVGSRKTPEVMTRLFIEVGALFASLGFILRSGGAPGADWAFETGCDFIGGKKEIYLPHQNFNGNPSPYYTSSIDAYELAEKFHPAWEKCDAYAQSCHARNSYQILGHNLDNPSTFLICWSPHKGGTEQAIRVAKHYNVPVFNFYNPDDEEKLHSFLKFTLRIKNL